MAYNKKKIFEQAKQAIEKNNLFFVCDVIAFLPCGHDTFYRFFPEGSEKSEALKALLDINKIRTKSGIRAKLYRSEKAGELLALYRMICTPEERQMINQNYIELTGKSFTKEPMTIEIIDSRDKVINDEDTDN